MNEYNGEREKLHTPLQTDRRSLSTRYSIHGTCDRASRMLIEKWTHTHTHTSKLWQIMQILVTCVCRMKHRINICRCCWHRHSSKKQQYRYEEEVWMATTMNVYLFNTQNQTGHEFYIWFQHMALFLINGSRNCRLSSFPISSSAFPNPSYALWMHTFWH